MTLTGDHFRILDILPYGPGGTPEDPVRCEYHTAALHNLPEYETLSYRWGEPEPRVPIDVGAEHIGVTRNLHDALLRLRRADQRRTIWIDQLCINQKDSIEKAAQVRLMRQIYSNCSVCNIWLDEIPSHVTLAGARSVLDFIRCTMSVDAEVPEYLRSEDSDDVVEELAKAFKVIGVAQHPWWTRIWTVQEAKLPPRKRLVWGPLEFSWEDELDSLVDAWAQQTFSKEASRLLERLHPAITAELDLLLPNVGWLDSTVEDMPALESVFVWRSRLATNPRDKVFAMQGLLPPDEIDLIHTHQYNYSTPVAQVYSAFTLDLVLGTESLEPLTLELQGDVLTAPANLPRWTINLLSENPYYGADRYYHSGTWEEFDACAGRPLDKKALLEAAAVPEWNMKVLGVTGVMVDTVEFIGARMLWVQHKNDSGPPDKVIIETLKSWMINARNYYLRENIDLYDRQFNEHFCRLLLGGLVRGWDWSIEREPNEEDLRKVAEYLHTGLRDTDWWMNEDLYCQVCNQAFFVTKQGLMGIGHLDTKFGDELWVFDGGNYPFTVRPRKGGSEDDFEFVGCSYVQGIMNGEVYKDMEAESLNLRRRIHLH